MASWFRLFLNFFAYFGLIRGQGSLSYKLNCLFLYLYVCHVVGFIKFLVVLLKEDNGVLSMSYKSHILYRKMNVEYL
jgi:hypothetical protein